MKKIAPWEDLNVLKLNTVASEKFPMGLALEKKAENLRTVVP